MRVTPKLLVAGAIAETEDEAVVGALKGQLKNVARQRQALVAEEEKLRAEFAAAEITEADREAIKAAAAEIRSKLKNPPFEQRRALFDMLDVRVELEWPG